MRANTPVQETEKPHGQRLVHLDRKEQLRAKKAYWFIRRLQDIVFSALALLLLLPLLLLPL